MANVVITGANRGIGLALTSLYAQRGDNVWALCRSASTELQELAAKNANSISVLENVDVNDFASFDTVLAPLKSQQIDVLINNAGILRNEVLGSINAEQIQMQFQTNALAPVMFTEWCLPLLGSGSKVGLITSRMGSVADNTSGGRYGYRMSKAALNIAGVSLAKDLQQQGIAVAILHPGYVSTGMVNFRGEVSAEFSATNLQQRMDELTLATTGTFWHANGEVLPW